MGVVPRPVVALAAGAVGLLLVVAVVVYGVVASTAVTRAPTGAGVVLSSPPTPGGDPLDQAVPVVPSPVASLPPAGAPQEQAAPAPSAPQQNPAPIRPPVLVTEWVSTTAAATGIPARSMQAYAVAATLSAAEDPECGLGWPTLAAIGWVESHHGSIGGRTVDAAGRPDTPVVGIALTGEGVANIPDSDDGRLDGDTGYDRAVGPMQFIPSTWALWGSDGDGDGVSEPQDVDDAALAAARYLCASGRDLSTGAGWSAALLSYNRSAAYVDQVTRTANTYATRSR